MNQFILASNSPRRKHILNKIELSFDVVPNSFEEGNSNYKSPVDLVRHYALGKANSVAPQFPDHIIIGADTIVTLDDQILEKPKDQSDAVKMLHALSDRTHRVFTGVALVKYNREASHSFVEQTYVTFVKLNNKMINYYVDNFHPFDKAGAYGIQDWSACFVKSINGCYYNVVGFPIARFMSIINSARFQNTFHSDNWLGKVQE